MNNFLKRLFIIIPILLLCAFVLVGCEKSQEKYTSNLENKGYTVEVLDNSSTVFALKATRTDEKGNYDYAFIYCFDSYEKCNEKFNEQKLDIARMKSLGLQTDATVYQDGKAFYYGSPQGVNDCK